MNETPQKRGKKGNKRSPNRVARFAAAHGMTEGAKREINRETGPKKDIISVLNENNKFSIVSLKITGKTWKNSSRSTGTSFLKSCQRVYLPYGKYNIKSKSNLAANPLTDHHIGWVLQNKMS